MHILKAVIKKIIFIVNTFYVICIGFLFWASDIVKKRYMDYKSTQDVISVMILGNGPSLNKIDLSKAKEDECEFCCVNFYPLKHKEDFFHLKPKYICLLDSEFYDIKIESLAETIRELYAVLNEISWDITVIAPKGRKMPINNPHLSYVWLSTYIPIYNSSRNVRNLLYRHNLAVTGAQNVIIGALNFFISCRCKTIYFAGVDMSEFKNIYVDDANRKYVDTTHSYGTERRYYDENRTTNWTDLAHILSAYCKMFLEFRHTSCYAHDMNVDVYNLSLDSYVDSFDKLSLYQKG